jgi:hypothetical protein
LRLSDGHVIGRQYLGPCRFGPSQRAIIHQILNF